MQEKDVSKQQVIYLVKMIAFFWLITKLWSYKTWVSDRLYPVIPPLDILKNIPEFWHQILFGLSLLSLLIIICFKENRGVLITLILSELLSCALDTVRWQPWEYMYLCFVLIVIINFYKPKNILLLSHLFLVSIYLFSGIHKMNRGFLSEVWLNMVLVNFLGLSMEFILKYKLFFAGLFIPIVEVILAMLLLVSKSKKTISYFLMFMHFTILIFIGPFGLKYNSVIWPWNLAMIFILMIVYLKPINSLDKKVFVYHWYWMVLWFVMPLFSFFGSWYQYFSFSLYSGKGNCMYICVSDKEMELSPYFTPDKNNFCTGLNCIDLQNWALEEIKSAPIPEIEIYNKIGLYLKHKYKSSHVKIILYDLQNQKSIEL
ncbi:hypothetical protein SAMN05443633_10595 [Chryseobacterium arachidis]|uniref:Uncharacterized protein n=2 Tax=Chryseobacterium arachidis TaxID=1416778 RepID=A0A1M5CYS3_9FLAO|nr:hypothetical protein SAMN05443633_10595 [Chryseobacterium arachidis]